MGYTRYWTYDRRADRYANAWPTLVADTRTILRTTTNTGIRITGPAGHGNPVIDTTFGIRLNGADSRNQAGESFVLLPPTPDNGESATGVVDDLTHALIGVTPGHSFAFCKTCQYPYDLAVTAVLLRFRLELANELTLARNGSWASEWVPARRLISELFGVETNENLLGR